MNGNIYIYIYNVQLRYEYRILTWLYELSEIKTSLLTCGYVYLGNKNDDDGDYSVVINIIN